MNHIPKYPSQQELDSLYNSEYRILKPASDSLFGQVFGRRTVLASVWKKSARKVFWLCQCSCGNKSIVKPANLLSGHSQSCGCLREEILTTKNGESKHHLYPAWKAMIRRCENPKDSGYHNYGGRGIAVCDQWKKSFQDFLSYVTKLDHFRKSGYSLDRIDNSLGYQEGNLRWATRLEQRRNTRVSGMSRK